MLRLLSHLPNILIVQADQFAAPAASLYGGFAHTPRLEALAESGAVFENAYCNFPLCAPSRLSMLTGQLAFTVGAYDNASELPSAMPTFLHHLRSAGYHTSLSGKMHFIGADQLHGFEERLTTDIYPADFAWLPDWETNAQNWAPIRDTIESAGVSPYNMQFAYDEDVTFRAVRKIYEYARQTADPFCLFVSLTHPHHPFLAPQEYWDRYEVDEIPEPSVLRLPDAELDPHSQRTRRVLGLDAIDVTDDERRRARHAYAAAISYFDDKLGALLDALATGGLADSTAVIVISDHGEMLGERGLWAKDSFFEWAMRIPTLVSIPGTAGSEWVERPVSLVDLFPTVLDIAGIPPTQLAEPAAGSSMLDAIGSTGVDGPDVCGEYAAEAAAAPVVMIRRGRYKYIHSDTDPPQLFDLEADPHERTNLATDPEHASVAAELGEAVADRWDLDAINADVHLSQRRRSVVSDALLEGVPTPWDFEPRPDHSKLYVRGRLGGEAADLRVRITPRDPPR